MAGRVPPPRPTSVKVPRWARNRQGGPRLPDVYDIVQADNLDRYHIGVYRGGWSDHVVEITEPGQQPTGAEPRAITVKVTRVLWPRDSLAMLEQASANYRDLSRYFGQRRN